MLRITCNVIQIGVWACTDLRTLCNLWRAAGGRVRREWPGRLAFPGTPAQSRQPLCWSRKTHPCSWYHVGDSPEYSFYWDSALLSSPTEREEATEWAQKMRVYLYDYITQVIPCVESFSFKLVSFLYNRDYCLFAFLSLIAEILYLTRKVWWKEVRCTLPLLESSLSSGSTLSSSSQTQFFYHLDLKHKENRYVSVVRFFLKWAFLSMVALNKALGLGGNQNSASQVSNLSMSQIPYSIVATSLSTYITNNIECILATI